MARLGYLPLILVGGVTTLAVLIMQAAAGTGGADPESVNILAILALPMPLFLAVLWGWTMLAMRPWRAVLTVALAALLVGGILKPGPMVAQAAANMGAGLIAGWALQRRLRLDLALVLCVGTLVPMVVWSLKEMPVAEQISLFRQDMNRVLEARIPDTADQGQREKALAAEGQRLDAALKIGAKLYPMVMALGLLAQAGLIMVLVWFSARVSGGITTGRRFGSFSRLRLPFYTVWLLIAGLGMALTRAEPVLTVGLNLSLLMALVLSVQGLAVQVVVVGRVLSPLGRLVFWIVMGVFLAPLVMASGILLGLADHWLDFRRLDGPVIDEDKKVV